MMSDVSSKSASSNRPPNEDPSHHLGADNVDNKMAAARTTTHDERHIDATMAEDGEEASKLPLSQRARLLFKRYGAVFVGTYISVYWTVLLAFYVGLDSGLLDPDLLSQLFRTGTDMVVETADIIGPSGSGASMEEVASAYANEVNTDITKDKRTLVDVVSTQMNNWEWSKKYAHRVSENPHLANLAVAWFMVKFTEPARLAAAVVLTPRVARAMGRDSTRAAAGTPGMKNGA
jgi:hypothetical protein